MPTEHDFTGRTALITVHLPIDLGVFVKIQELLLPLMDGEGPWDEQVYSDGDHITFYAAP